MAKTLTPVFAGETPQGDKIVLYLQGFEMHLMRPDGELVALGPDAVLDTWFDPVNGYQQLKIQSSAWTGEAIGSRKDLVEEPKLILDYREEPA